LPHIVQARRRYFTKVVGLAVIVRECIGAMMNDSAATGARGASGGCSPAIERPRLGYPEPQRESE
jgi:hypothetical protein